MRSKKEIIELDTRLISVLNKKVYVAELENGHRLLALVGCRGGLGPGCPNALGVGDWVVVQMHPGDMDRGWVVRKMRLRAEASKDFSGEVSA